MQIALVHSHFDAAHLADVQATMARLGAPSIRAVDLGEGRWQALEGCHRLRAAAELGLVPDLVSVEYSDELLTSLGLDFDGDWTVAQLCDDSYRATWIAFED